jgi:signal transduction histidine kinase
MERILNQLYLITSRLLEVSTDEKTYATMLKSVSDLLKGKYGTAWVIKGAKQELAFSSAPNNFQINFKKIGLTNAALKKERLCYLTMKEVEAHEPNLSKLKLKTKFVVIVPLSYNDNLNGVLTVFTNYRLPTGSSEEKILQLFASLCSLRIRNMQLFAKSQQAVESRDLFIGMASHELKTPLTTIFLYNQLIKKIVKQGKMPPLKWVDMVYDQAVRLKHLTNELLQVENINAGQLLYIWQHHDLIKVIREVKTVAASLYPDRSFKLVRHKNISTIWIDADKEKLIQALVNVTNNAAKYSKPGSEVVITISSKGSRVLVEIKDDGVGIPKDDLDHLFTKFYTGSRNKASGMGLGLFISKIIIDRHHGKIKVKSRINYGTRVIIELPRLRKSSLKHNEQALVL